MAKKKKKKKSGTNLDRPSNLSSFNQEFASASEPEIPDLSDDDMMKTISEMQRNNPEMMENIFNELNSWRDDFVKEHGHEPSEEDLMAVFDEDDWNDLDDYDDDMDEDNIPKICRTCAWCQKEIGAGEERFTFGIKTRIDVTPFDDPTQPMTMTLSENKALQAIITALDSPARKDGYQLIVMCCSEICIQETQKALQRSINIDNITMLN